MNTLPEPEWLYDALRLHITRGLVHPKQSWPGGQDNLVIWVRSRRIPASHCWIPSDPRGPAPSAQQLDEADVFEVLRVEAVDLHLLSSVVEGRELLKSSFGQARFFQ